jgi:hypothetical protein
MRRSADASDVDGFEAFARALQSTFPARDDAPLVLALLRFSLFVCWKPVV